MHVFLYLYFYIFKYRVSKYILRSLRKSFRLFHRYSTLKTIFARRGVACSSACSAVSLSFLFSLPLSLSVFLSSRPVLPVLEEALRKGPVTSRLLGRSKYLNLTPRSRGQEKGTCSFGTGRSVITYPMLRPPGPARVDVIKTNDLKTQLPSLRLLKCLSGAVVLSSTLWPVSFFLYLYLSLFLAPRHTKVTFAGRLADRHHDARYFLTRASRPFAIARRAALKSFPSVRKFL